MKTIIFIAITAVLTSCNSKDEQFCKCMEAGEKLNAFSTTLFEEEITAEKAEKLKKLKAIKKEECADYQLMGGEEMLKKKAECK